MAELQGQQAAEGWRRVLDLTLRLTQRSVTSEFKGTVLGRVWSFINPLATIVVFTVVFGLVFRAQVPPGTNSGINSFALWIGVGVLCWSFLSGAIMAAMNSIVGNAGLLTKVYFPRQVVIYSAVLSLAVDFIFELLVLVVVAMFMGGPGVLAMVPALLVVTILTALFSTGLGMALSIVVVYFRDVVHLWQIFNQVWMYASGVIFPISQLEDVQNTLAAKGWLWHGGPIPLTTIFRFNPAETYLEAFRSCLYDFALPSWPVLGACVFWAAFAMLIGSSVFRRFQAHIVEEL